MIKKKIFKLTLLFVASVFILTGCGNNAEDSVNLSATEGAEELNVAFMGLPATMDAHKAYTNYDAQYLDPCTGQLFRIDPVKGAVPELAEGYQVSEDGKTYTVRLRDNIRYSNGTEITAHDFVYGFRRVVDPKEASNEIFVFEDICELKNVFKVNSGELPLSELGVKAEDDRTLVIELENPCPYFLYVLTMPATSPCNEEFVRECNGRYATGPDTLLSSGPFYVDKFEPLGIQIHYSPNPYYINSDNVKLSGISFRQVANVQQAEMAYQTGLVDAINVSKDYLVLSGDDPNLRSVTGGVIYYINGNFEKSKAFQNRNIRLALAKALDRDTIMKDFFRAGNESLTRIIPRNCTYESDGTDFAYDSDRYKDLCGYDPDKAKEYWEQGLKELGVSEVELELVTRSGSEEFIEILKDGWEEILPGFKLNVRVVPPSQFQDIREKGDFDMYYGGWGADYPDPNSFLDILGSDSSVNDGHYSNPQYDRLLQEAQLEGDADKRLELLHKAEDTVMNDMAMIPLYSQGESWIISDRIEGLEIIFSGKLLCNMSKKQ